MTKSVSRCKGLDRAQLKSLLDTKVAQFNRPEFIIDDPISIPHRYERQQDIEIAAFWTAILSWGRRQTIINKAKVLFGMMGDSPYEFIINHHEKDRRPFLEFVHRTFQPTDTLYFLHFLQLYYRRHTSLETAFTLKGVNDIRANLTAFHNYFFDSELAPARTRKHVSTPRKGANCKRLNMFLRWMVRRDDCGVDFGLWQHISPSALMIPLDVHVMRVTSYLGLTSHTKPNWQTVAELTDILRSFDPEDPVKYDFALFGMGVLE